MQREESEYASWISNASGRLQFDLTTLDGYRNDRVVGDGWHTNRVEDGSHILFVTLLADLRDRFVRDSSIYSRIFLYAKEFHSDDETSYMRGSFYLLDDSQYPSLYKDHKEQKFLDEIIQCSQESIADTHKTLKSYLESLSPQRYIQREIHFKLYQNGYILLSSNNSDVADIKSAYFFIKFLFHKDRFHSQNAENIVPLIKIGDTLDLSRVSAKIYESLIAYVAQQRKIDSSPISLSWLDGVLLYTKSFLLISKEFLGEEAYKQKSDGLSILSNTITEELKRKPYRASTIYQFFEDFRLFAFIITLVLAIFKFFPDDKLANDILFYLLPSTPTGTVVVILVFSFTATSIVQILYNGTMSHSYFSIFQKIWNNLLSCINRHSKPNIDSKIEVIQKYLIPSMIHLEMSMRRNLRWRYKLLFFVLLMLLIIGSLLYYNYLYFMS
ncbi:MAG: hypothetical protein U9R27_09565 [Campylobacterota bacterium]|nr:hypothetical protein [Campylobacterota bacterium]